MDEYKENRRKQIYKRNIGIEILRMFLCFRIIILHYYSSDNRFILKLKWNRFQVPCFFFISFYFLYPIIFTRNIRKFKLRLERLLILWFHFNLIFFTLLFFIFSFLLKDQFLIFFQTIALISYIIQYSKINYLFFKKYTENIWMSIGNLSETIPVAVIAFSLANIEFCSYLTNHSKKYFFFSIFSFYLISIFPIFSRIDGFSSPGIKQTIVSILLFNTFYLIPLEMLNTTLLTFIRLLTKYTQGIYCLHFLFQYYMKIKFDKEGSFIGCIILYIVSYFVSFLGFKLFGNTKLRFLFS